MKVQIDIDAELWAKFRAKVHHQDKTLGEVVPLVVEPALRAYVDGDQLPLVAVETVGRTMFSSPAMTSETVKRCELCDMPTERFHLFQNYRVCYSCWKKGITAPTPPDAA